MEAWLENLKHQLGLKPEAALAEVMSLADQRLHAAAAFAEAAGLLGLPEAASAAQVKGAILALQSSLEHLSRVQEELARLIHEGDERPLPKRFLRRRSQRGEQSEGGKSLEIVFSGKSIPGGCIRTDFGRTYPQG
ncbi:MAG: hypothetical protein M0P73_17145 [Syntrophobacterales bacterium]|nr:hypothetical protein [Syntrophobacterales bacterium]